MSKHFQKEKEGEQYRLNGSKNLKGKRFKTIWAKSPKNHTGLEPQALPLLQVMLWYMMRLYYVSLRNETITTWKKSGALHLRLCFRQTKVNVQKKKKKDPEIKSKLDSVVSELHSSDQPIYVLTCYLNNFVSKCSGTTLKSQHSDTGTSLQVQGQPPFSHKRIETKTKQLNPNSKATIKSIFLVIITEKNVHFYIFMYI